MEFYEDDRDPYNYKFIIVKEKLRGLSLEQNVKDMTKVELACIINQYAECLKSLNPPNF